jgi:hypothetical protein
MAIAKVFCRSYDDGKCTHEERMIFGLIHRRCCVDPGDEGSCSFREPPERPRALFDALSHGPAIDPDGFEWEVAKVTKDSVILRVRDPYDGAVHNIDISRSSLGSSDPTHAAD